MDARVKAILAHITPVGWIIALLLNSSYREEYTSFYIRQTLGIWLVGAVISWIPILNVIGGVLVFAFWLLSLIYVIQHDKKEVPFGYYFQEWFSSL